MFKVIQKKRTGRIQAYYRAPASPTLHRREILLFGMLLVGLICGQAEIQSYHMSGRCFVIILTSKHSNLYCIIGATLFLNEPCFLSSFIGSELARSVRQSCMPFRPYTASE